MAINPLKEVIDNLKSISNILESVKTSIDKGVDKESINSFLFQSLENSSKKIKDNLDIIMKLKRR